MESLSFRLIETTRRLKEEITSATEEHFELTEKKVFDAYNSQKETNRQFETELRVLREKVIGSAQSGGGLHSAQDDLGELLRLKKNGSILEGISSALLNLFIFLEFVFNKRQNTSNLIRLSKNVKVRTLQNANI